MKSSELIKKLKEFPADMNVILSDHEAGQVTYTIDSLELMTKDSSGAGEDVIWVEIRRVTF